MKVAVVGGGISGLSAAYHLLELSRKKNIDLDIEILESSDSMGGIVSTKYKNGFIIEEGADSFITTKPHAIELCNKLGLQEQLISTNENNRSTFVYFKDKLVPLPKGFYMMAPSSFISLFWSSLFSFSGKLRACYEQFISRGVGVDDESLSSFVTRRFGKELLERVAQPLIAGIYTGDADKLSLKATMPHFVEMEKKYGSVTKGIRKGYLGSNSSKDQSGARYSLFTTIKDGMRSLIDRIVEALPNNSVKLNCYVEGLRKTKTGWELITSEKDQKVDALIIATPAYTSSIMLENIDKELSASLSKIIYASSVVVNLAYKLDDFSFPKCFGVVVPQSEDKNIISCSFSSQKFNYRAPEGYGLLRCFLGGVLRPNVIDWDEATVLRRTLEELEMMFKVTCVPEFYLMRKYRNSMPQYNVGYLDLLRSIKEKVSEYEGLALAGSAYNGVGMPDCILSGQIAAEKIFEELHSS